MPVWSNPEFDWNDDNVDHIINRHRVYPEEAEQVFFNRPHIRRQVGVYHAYGRDDAGHYLFVAFVMRGSFIRVISARPMTPPERRLYDRH